ncbi:hypothetical protein PInf_007802 [Phytophthora infestans]|nr:hypothetical protein PInf_007802 [Phytophthora infestans]
MLKGEDAAVRYAISSGLINLDESSDDNGQESDENVRPSQIDCSLMLSAPTLDALFDGSSDANEENAGPDTGVAAPAADIAQQLPGQIGLSDEDVVVGAFQRMLSEAESEGHVQFSDNESKQDDVERVDTSPPAVHVRADDVNVLQEDEHSDDFECMESSTSDDGGDDCKEDDVVERREHVEDDDELPDDELKLVDEAFVASLGGTLSIANIDKDALRLTKWMVDRATRGFQVTKQLLRTSYGKWQLHH